MKKVSALAIILLSIVLLPCYGQVKGVDFTTAILWSSIADDDDPMLYEVLLGDEDGNYVLLFEQTPVGYKHCLDKAKRILSDNGKSFSKDRIVDDVMYPSNVEGLTDYQRMPHELMMSKAEVVLSWQLTDEYHLRVFCNDEVFSVILIPSDEVQD